MLFWDDITMIWDENIVYFLNEKKQDSKELSPRSLVNMLLKLQVNFQNVQSTQLSKFDMILKHV